VDPEFVMYFGSRRGSFTALTVFLCVFAMLGFAARAECRHLGCGARLATSVGLALFLGPLGFVYASSLSGFYELRGHPTHLEAHFLFPSPPSRIAWSALVQADAQLAFKSRWRLRLVAGAGEELVSATWNRHDVVSAANDIRQRLLDRSR